MIVAHSGIQADVSTERLPADAVPALFAYSLNRKLRKLYAGNYFQFRQGSTIKEYPRDQIDSDQTAYLVKIYDQKAKHGVPVRDAVQLDPSRQPTLTFKDDAIRANFNQYEYLDIQELAPFIGHNFTITAYGDGSKAPTPMIGIWSTRDKVTIEPSDLATRFTFNGNLGTIIDSDNRAHQCFLGVNPRQNGERVLTINNTRGGNGHVISSTSTPSFTNISIGRVAIANLVPTGGGVFVNNEEQRFYEGDFTEVTMHLDQLTELGADQLLKTTRTSYGY